VLPAPTGRFPVGRVSYDWLDPTRAEVYASDVRARRELVVWIWYPAASVADLEPAAYLPAPWRPAAEFLGLDTAGLRSHALPGAPAAEEDSPYPVLVLSPSGFPPLMLAALAEEVPTGAAVGLFAPQTTAKCGKRGRRHATRHR
jgi:hypothetical protein